MVKWLYKEYVHFQPAQLSNMSWDMYKTQAFSKLLFLLPVTSWSRAEAIVEAVEKSSSHLVFELLFSHPVCVPHAKICTEFVFLRTGILVPQTCM